MRTFLSGGKKVFVPDLSLQNKLLALWEYNTSPGMLVDSKGVTNMTAVGAPTLVAGAKGQALHADDVDDYVNANHNTTVDRGPEEGWTIVYWARVPGSQVDTTENGLAKWDGAFENSDYESTFGVTPGGAFKVRTSKTAAGASTTAQATSAAYAGAWMFCVSSFDPVTDTVSAQINNGTPATASEARAWATVTDGTLFSLGFGNPHATEVDAVCLFNSVLSATELTWLYTTWDGTYSGMADYSP